LEINMSMWDDNTKMDIKENSFVFRVNFSPQQWAKQDFWKIC